MSRAGQQVVPFLACQELRAHTDVGKDGSPVRRRWDGGVLHDHLLLSPASKMLADRAYRRSLAFDVFSARRWCRIVDFVRGPEIRSRHHVVKYRQLDPLARDSLF